MAVGRRDEVVLITGCSSGGIGAELALEFNDAGYTVVATSRSLSTMKMFEPYQHIHIFPLDLLSANSIKQAVETVMEQFGRIDILINNAATPCTGPLAEVPIEIVETVYRTNYLGPVMLIQAVVPHMVAKGKGKIVNVGSITCFASGPFSGVYASSKAALHSCTDSLRLELKPFNVDVMLLVPGAIVTSIVSNGNQVVKSFLSSLQIYKDYEDYLMKRITISHDPKATPAPEFAKKAVAVILRSPSPACFTYGFMSGVFRVLYFSPYWIRDLWFASGMPKWMLTKQHHA